MAESKAQNGLFSEDELVGIQPSGSPWIISQDDPATVPVPLQTSIVEVRGTYTERDRKLWVFLLHAVFDELGNTPMHSLSVREINAVFREMGGDHSTKWLWESVKRLAGTVAEWKTVCEMGDERFEELGISALLFANLSKRTRETGRLTFGFPPNLIPIIKEPMRFARLRVHFLLKLSGKYAVTLYEVLEGFANRRDGRCEVSIADLRMWLKVPDGSYKTWKDFRRWVLDPAVKQINDDPIGAGFQVKYAAIRKGRSYEKVVFEITKTDNRAATERLMKQKAKLKKDGGDIAIEPWAEDKARKSAIQTGWDYAVLKREWMAYARAETARGNPPKNAGAAFVAFCSKKEILR